MQKIRIDVQPGYDVLLGWNLMQEAGSLLQPVLAAGSRILLVSDSNVRPLYGDRVAQSLAKAGFKPDFFVIPAGEASKNMANFGRILEYLAGHHFTRSDCVASLGGGVSGDLAGFSAACYMRGIPFVQIPTSLLADVDSSVGGKTAVNLEKGKNLAGAFWQPRAVLCDLEALKTLPFANFAEGMAEVLKYGVLESEELFTSLEQGCSPDKLENAVASCIAIKGRYVAEDERDVGRRQFLNLGHTIGHAVERYSGYRISHGDAVAIGMMKITETAVRRKIADPEMLPRLKNALLQNLLPVECTFPMQNLLEIIANDKKRQGSMITLVIPEKIGRCRLEKMPVDDLAEFLCG